MVVTGDPLVGVGPCGPSAPPRPMASSAVAQDAVSAAAPFIVTVVSLALRGRLSKLPGLLVDAAA